MEDIRSASAEWTSTALQKAYLLGADGPLSAGSQILNSLGVVPQIQLASDQDDWQTVAEVQDFRDPLQDGMCKRDESWVS